MCKAVVCCPEHVSPNKAVRLPVRYSRVFLQPARLFTFPQAARRGSCLESLRTQEPSLRRLFSGQNCPSLVKKQYILFSRDMPGRTVGAGRLTDYKSVRFRLSWMLEATFETPQATLQNLLAAHATNAAAASYRLSRSHGVRDKVRLGVRFSSLFIHALTALGPVYTRSPRTLPCSHMLSPHSAMLSHALTALCHVLTTLCHALTALCPGVSLSQETPH